MDKQALDTPLASIFASDDLLRDEPLSKHTTFRCGGPATFFVRASEASDVAAAIEAAKKNGAPWWVIGCGSDLLISDAGLPGVVIEIGQRMARISVEGSVIKAQAGATNEAVAHAALDAGLAGYEFASGIPGSIGGAAIMNAGAYDGEFKDVAVSVTCLFPDGQVREVPAAEANWGYRHSMMSDKGLIVLSATLQLAPGNPEEIRAKMDDLAQRRSSKQPLEMASAGSTFKRPEGYFAGKLIQDAGMQGHSVGDAQVSTKHAGFVVNTGSASASDVLQVIRDVQAAVKEQFGVTLETEVRMWGF
jgi:UDP-N-acetylmuramate dehydrogenase